MRAIFVESGLELRILTDHFIAEYFKEGIIVTIINDEAINNFAALKNIPVFFIENEADDKRKWLYAIEQIQKIRLLKLTKSKYAIKLSKTYQTLTFLPMPILGVVFRLLDFAYRSKKFSIHWASLTTTLKANQVKEIIFAGHTGRIKEIISRIAEKNGIKTFVIQNSWKDLFINPYLQFNVDKMNVWSKDIAGIYAHLNSQYKHIKWIVNWHPRLIELIQASPIINEIEENITTILYTCANPKNIINEFEILNSIIDAVDKKIKFIIRPNPQDENVKRWDKLEMDYCNCVIDPPDWYWNSLTKINAPSPLSEEKWKQILIKCNIVMNIASTVTVESLLMQKNVINITFGSDGKPSELIKAQTYLPYYEGIVRHPNLFICDTLSELNRLIDEIKSTSFSNQPIDQYLTKKEI